MLRTILLPSLAIAITLAPNSQLHADDRPAAANEQGSAASIDSIVEKKVSLELVDMPLRDFAALISKHIGQPCLLERRALEDVGIGDGERVTCKFDEMSLRSVLSHALRDLDLAWVVDHGALLITTPEEAESHLATKVLDVVDLIRVENSWEEDRFDYDSLIELITATIEPSSWDSVGGPGAIEAFRGGVVISQTRDVHEQIEQLLRQYRKARQLAEKHVESPPPVNSVGPADGDPTMTKIKQALAQSIVPEFDDMPLELVARNLAQLREINVLIDIRALDDVGISADVPVSFHTGPIPLRDALRHILDCLDLAYTIRDEALVITTPEEAEGCVVAEAYPVADLLGNESERDEFGDSRREASMDDLIELITSTVKPYTWDVVGGPGSVAVCSHIDVLVISQTGDVHELVADLLGKIRANLAQQKRPAQAPEVASGPSPTRLVVYTVPTESPEDNKKTPRQQGKETDEKQSQHSSANRSALSQMMGGGMGGLGGPMGYGAPFAVPVAIPETELLQTITQMIEPQSWHGREDVYARVLPGRLLIRHTDAVHRQIERLLDKLQVSYGANARWGMQFGGGMF